MAFSVNHKLVYEAQPIFQELWAQRNKARTEKEKADRLERELIGKIAKLLAVPVETLSDRDTSVCIARGVGNHLYRPANGHSAHVATGVGHRVCVFCGLDDFDA